MAGHVAATIVAVQALGCAVLAVAFPLVAARDAGLGTASHLMFSVFIGLFAVGLGFVSRGLWRGLSWPRPAAVVWLVVLLPVASAMAQAGWRLVGYSILGTAVAAIVALVAESRSAAKSRSV